MLGLAYLFGLMVALAACVAVALTDPPSPSSRCCGPNLSAVTTREALTIRGGTSTSELSHSRHLHRGSATDRADVHIQLVLATCLNRSRTSGGISGMPQARSGPPSTPATSRRHCAGTGDASQSVALALLCLPDAACKSLRVNLEIVRRLLNRQQLVIHTSPYRLRGTSRLSLTHRRGRDLEADDQVQPPLGDDLNPVPCLNRCKDHATADDHALSAR
jgi:hypothetical protein